MNNYHFKVSLIPQNLHKNETLVQIAAALKQLSNVTEDVLQHIDNKINDNNKKLLNINNRVDIVDAKITKLCGAKKATQVFSCSKYPGVDREYTSIFENIKPTEPVKYHVSTKNINKRNERLEKLHIYHVKLNDIKVDTKLTGLGDIPKDIKHVNDVLLYNSGKNLYETFVMSDSLQVNYSNVEQVEEKKHLGLAPASISIRNSVVNSEDSYFYSPNLGDVPTLDVPLDLPNLPGIASDLRYRDDSAIGIAPSVSNVTSPVAENISSLLIQPEIKAESFTSNIVTPTEEVLVIPSPIEKLKTSEEQDVKEIHTSKNDNRAESPVKTETKSTELPKLPLAELDVHASLMAAIRKVGGSKSASLKKPSSPKEKTSKLQGAGNDLIADLHAKLSMRRKGISGAKNTNNPIDASSTLSRISQMIPPPSTTKDPVTDDDDWD